MIALSLGLFDLDELERLEKAATPGEWLHDEDPRPSGTDQIIDDRDLTICFMSLPTGDQYDNAALIVALRNAAPEIIAELRAQAQRISELEAERDSAVNAMIEDASAGLGDQAEIGQLKIRVEELEAALREIIEGERIETYPSCSANIARRALEQKP